MKNPFESGKVRITQTYHSDHLALDLVSEGSWNVVALEDARIVTSAIVTDKSDLTWTYGNFIRYILADGTSILCAHLSKRLVKAGDIVKKGQIIGVMGSTGYSTGAHLHIEHRAANASTRLPVYEYIGCKNEKGYCTPIEEKEQEEVIVESKEIHVGDKVKIVSGASYTNGVKVPEKYVNKEYTVSKKLEGRSLILELYSWVSDDYLVKIEGEQKEREIEIGSKVKIKEGAVYTNGVPVPSSCIGIPYTVMEINTKNVLLQEIFSRVEHKYLEIV